MFKIFTSFLKKKQFINSTSFSNFLHNFNHKPLLSIQSFDFCNLSPPKGCGKEKCGCAGTPPESDKEKQLKTLNYKIIQCINLGNFDEGIELSDKYISDVEQSYGTDHPFYCSAINNKAFILKTCGEYNEAKVLYEEASEKYKCLYSEKSEKYIITMQNLATVYRELKDSTKSLEIYDIIIKIVENTPNLVQPNIIANIYLTAAGKYISVKTVSEYLNPLMIVINY